MFLVLLRSLMLIHLSPGYFHEQPFISRSPCDFENNFISNELEDSYIKRTCFSNNINNCLSAFDNWIVGLNFNIYIPKNIDILSFVSNEDIIKNKYVADAKITKEYWLLNNPIAVHIGQIKITEVKRQYVITFDNQNLKQDFLISEYNWKFTSEQDHKIFKELSKGDLI